ncbi:GpE family phage tail protein [Blastochloris tepida]|uniref:GpE family phage tail protein n=1 Tax=Blastochloris tepida TaxID=2233851 RepID=A0A348FYG4_9HYPH|nr:GpE family phage tail protein [Blastochloris tepida]BBF92347.1 hypothetical protein BLTE_10320 [Blastochloris tepida]
MADLAFAFHWGLGELDGLSIDELLAWHARARARLEAWGGGA